MKSQKDLIHDKDWDLLIILDACRYDYFEKVYGEYLDGMIEKVWSPASTTAPGCRKVFDEKFNDTIYVSGNPTINSHGIMKDKFDSSGKFKKVVDSWDKDWSEDVKTVKPKDLVKRTLLVMKSNPDLRIISHFMQPHYPYLGHTDILENRDENTFKKFAKWGNKLFGRGRWRRLEEFMGKIFSDDDESRESVKPAERIAHSQGKNFLRRCYKENLKIALEEVSNLVARIDCKVAITSDHGELLGEDNLYSHPKGVNHSILRTVPWLEVKK